MIGAETGLRDVMRQVEQVAPTSAPVLIFGETGSGKEVVARAIHERSERAHGPILRVNCGAISPEGGRLDIPRALGASVVDGSAFPTLNLTICRHIERALKHCRGRIDGPRGAARLLGLNPNTLRSKIAKFDIRIAAFRPDLD